MRVSFLISDDDGRQISEAAVKNCRRDWKTHFGEGRERKRKPAIELKAESFFDHNSCPSLYRDLKKLNSFKVAFRKFYLIFAFNISSRSKNSALSTPESADVLFMLGQRKEAGSSRPLRHPRCLFSSSSGKKK